MQQTSETKMPVQNSFFKTSNDKNWQQTCKVSPMSNFHYILQHKITEEKIMNNKKTLVVYIDISSSNLNPNSLEVVKCIQLTIIHC